MSIASVPSFRLRIWKNLWFNVGGWRGVESWFPSEFRIQRAGSVGGGERSTGIGIRFLKIYLSLTFVSKYERGGHSER